MYPTIKRYIPWNDTSLFVVTSSIAGQLKDFSSQILHDGSQVDGGTGTNTFGIVSLSEQTMDTSNRELKTGS